MARQSAEELRFADSVDGNKPELWKGELDSRLRAHANELELHSTVIKNMAEGVCLIRPSNGIIQYANPRFARMFGYEPGELDGKPVTVLNYEGPALSAEATAAHITRSTLARGEYTYEVHNVKKDGTPFWCRATTSVFEHDTLGCLLVAVQEDISLRKESEEELAASERKYRSMIESAYDAILVTDMNGNIVLANKELCKSFGYSTEELTGNPVEMLLPEKARAEHALKVQNFMRRPSSRPMGAGLNLYGRRKNGSTFPVDIGLSSIETPEGLRVTAFIRDISERKRTEEEFRLLSDLGKVMADALGYEDRIRLMADLLVPRLVDACAISLLEEGELKLKAAKIREPSQQKRFEGSVRQALLEKNMVGPQAAINRGKVIWSGDFGDSHLTATQKERIEEFGFTNFATFPLVSRGKPMGTLSLAMTNSGRGLATRDLTYLELVAGRFATVLDNAGLYLASQRATKEREAILSIVSHDLKNPLGVIDMAAQMLKIAGKNEAQVQSLTARIRRASAQMQRLIADLLDFTRIDAGTMEIQYQELKVASLLEAAWEPFIEKAHHKNVRMHISMDPRCGSVSGDEGRILQVLWNLVGNAVKFTPDGGEITLSAFPESGLVRFAVRDSGPGIAAEYHEKIFERFWQAETTASLGTGLGLSIAKAIVKAHGGTIGVDSVLGEGSTFFFAIPEQRGPSLEEEILHAR